jgi:hypothetical protein
MLRWSCVLLDKHVDSMAGSQIHIFPFGRMRRRSHHAPVYLYLCVPLTPLHATATFLMLDIKH